jgi:hypothetical protein
MELQAPRSTTGAPLRELTAQEAAFAKAASAWVTQLSRALKTCRLYDAANPTVLHFREELAFSLARLLEEHGSLTLRFSATDVSWSDISLYRVNTREDNLALAFYRDGVRALTFSAGIEPREIGALVDAVLEVTRRTAADADLVTLLWDAELVHVRVDCVSSEADVEGEAASLEGAAPSGPLMPWPKPAPATDPEAALAGNAAAPDGAPGVQGEPGRADDWVSGGFTAPAEAAFEELEAQAPREIARFRSEHDAECQTSVLTASLALLRECLLSGATDADRGELAHLLPRVLQEAIAFGDWFAARQAVHLLQTCGEAEEVLAGLLEELRQPASVVTASAARELDQQGTEAVQDFLTLARTFGTDAVDWLMAILADCKQEGTRCAVAQMLAELCADNPECLAPWLSDPREVVVCKVVQALGLIGGEAVVGLLGSVAKHPEPRVRKEVVWALAHAEPSGAREVLLGMLEGAETRIFCAVLHQLSSVRDPGCARLLVGQLCAAGFHDRPIEERRAVYSTLACVGGDEVLPALEEELHRSRWFAGGHDEHRKAIARCIARIGTPDARQLLERGARARSGEVRAACTQALDGARSHE